MPASGVTAKGILKTPVSEPHRARGGVSTTALDVPRAVVHVTQNDRRGGGGAQSVVAGSGRVRGTQLPRQDNTVGNFSKEIESMMSGKKPSPVRSEGTVVLDSTWSVYPSDLLLQGSVSADLHVKNYTSIPLA